MQRAVTIPMNAEERRLRRTTISYTTGILVV